MDFDHIHFQVDNVDDWRRWFANAFKFRYSDAPSRNDGLPSNCELMTQGEVCIGLSPLARFDVPLAQTGAHPKNQHPRRKAHPPGVRDVAFRVPSLEQAIARVLDAGGTLISPVRSHSTSLVNKKCATVLGWGDLHHTLIEIGDVHSDYDAPEPADSGYRHRQRESQSRSCSAKSRQSEHADVSLDADAPPPATRSTLVCSHEQETFPNRSPLISAIDHVVLNVPAGELEPAANWYAQAFGLEKQQQFSIQTEQSALHSQVLRHPNGNVQFPINEPASPHSQIQEFLDAYGGAGIQHIALRTERIQEAIAHMHSQGVAFLDVPTTYYEQLRDRPEFSPDLADWEAIARLKILVDWPTPIPDALLLQTFTQPLFEQPTFFFEIIQRQSYQTPQGQKPVQGFGEGNFQALFEAVEREQMKRGHL